MIKNTMIGLSVVLPFAGVVACSGGESSLGEGVGEGIAEEGSAILPCDPNAPFGEISKVPYANRVPDSDLNNFNGLTFWTNAAGAMTAYLSSPHLSDTSYDIMKSVSGGFADVVGMGTLTQVNIDDTAPFVRANGLTMYLNRSNDILTYTRPTVTPNDDNWTLVATPPGINQPGRDQDPFYVEGLSALFFATDRANGSLDLWRRTSAGSVAPVPGTDLNHPTENDYHPVMSSNGLQIYFASTRTGIGGDHDGDIFVATRTGTGLPFNAASNVYSLNSSGQEFPVAISSDNCTLYFASNEEHGFSNVQNHRLYQAKRQENTPAVTNMTLVLTGTGTVTGGGFNCSHVAGNPAGGTGTCSVSAPPNTLVNVSASPGATWKGSCTANGAQPNASGVLTYGPLLATCNVAF